MHIDYAGPSAKFRERRLLTTPCPVFFEDAIRSTCSPRRRRKWSSETDWRVSLGADLLFDAAGLRAIVKALRCYRGSASEIRFRLKLHPAAYRDYYSLGASLVDESVELPVTAHRACAGPSVRRDVLDLHLDYFSKEADYPRSLSEPMQLMTPMALLLEYHGEFDWLFANQIAVFSELARQLRSSPVAWLRGAFSRRRGNWARRASVAWSRIHSTADVHPTAVVEGSVIGAGARVGAHCVVRYSHIGEGAQLFDGAKVECSVVGPGSWLMHDLVLFRCHVEDQVFLIHGPYQFSCFHSGSAAFATIMMDYRPDAKPIKALTSHGVRPYQGRFLGAVLRENAKSLGGSLLAPGLVVPVNTWLAGELSTIHRPGRTDLPQATPVPPAFHEFVRQEPASAKESTSAKGPLSTTTHLTARAS